MANSRPPLPARKLLPSVPCRVGKSFLRCAVVIAAISQIGCGGDGASVSGRVTFDGQPISNGTITFSPEGEQAERKPVQTEITDGGFAFEPHHALLPGRYKVAVRANRKTGQVPPEPGSTEVVDRYEQYIPVIYNSRTELTADITGDVDSLDFELRSIPPTRGRRR